MAITNGWAKWASIATVVVALPTVGWATGWAGSLVEHFQVVGSNQRWIALAEFKHLQALKNQRELTFSEWVTWCELGLQLRFFRVCPPR